MCKIKICGLTRPEDIDAVNEFRPEFAGFVFAKSRRKVSAVECKNLCEKLNKNIKRVGVFVNEEIDNVLDIAKHCELDVLQLHGEEDEIYLNNLKAKINEQHKKGKDSNYKIQIWKHIGIPVLENNTKNNTGNNIDNKIETNKNIQKFENKNDRIDVNSKNNMNISNNFSPNSIMNELKKIEQIGVDAVLYDTYFNGERGGTGKSFDWSLLEGNKTSLKAVLAGGLDDKNVLRAVRMLDPWAVDVSSGVETDGLKDREKIRRFIAAIRSYE